MVTIEDMERIVAHTSPRVLAEHVVGLTAERDLARAERDALKAAAAELLEAEDALRGRLAHDAIPSVIERIGNARAALRALVAT